MDSYQEWRKMVYDVAKLHFPEICNYKKSVEINENFIKIDDSLEMDRYSVEGMCAYETKYFSKISKPSMGIYNYDTDDKGFRTAQLSKNNLDNLLVACCGTTVFFEKYDHSFILTVEGIKVYFAPEKKKFFMHDGFDRDKANWIALTYEEMATNKTFEIPGSIKIDGKKMNLHNPFQWYLHVTVPKLLDLYRNNKVLYMDALDEICGDEY